MTDLWVAIAAILPVSVVAFTLGRRIPRRASRAAAVLVAMLLVLYVWRLADDLRLVRLAPMSSAVVLTNVVPPLTALLAGIAWGRGPGAGRVRRTVLLVPLLLLALYHAYGRLVADVPPLDERWRRGVCVQTSSASCSAAAAATLLSANGISATEAEMARLCLTRADGTPMLGLYRGLVLKTAGTPWRVETFRAGAGADVASGAEGPAILSVGLPRNRDGLDPRYEQQWGWAPGVRHTVVVFGKTAAGNLDVGDPAVGREQWTPQDLRVLWSGDGIRLVKR